MANGTSTRRRTTRPASRRTQEVVEQVDEPVEADEAVDETDEEDEDDGRWSSAERRLTSLLQGGLSVKQLEAMVAAAAPKRGSRSGPRRGRLNHLVDRCAQASSHGRVMALRLDVARKVALDEGLSDVAADIEEIAADVNELVERTASVEESVRSVRDTT